MLQICHSLFCPPCPAPDSRFPLADFYLRETVQGTDATPDDIAALAENVTAEDVAAIARGVELDAVYFLRGEEAETE